MNHIKKIKWLFLIGFVLFISFAVVISALISSFAAIIAGGGSSRGVKEKDFDINNYKSNVEIFKVEGNRTNTTYNLNFIFNDWSINNISGGDEIKQTVNSLKLAGTAEEIAYQYLRNEGYGHTGTCAILSCIHANTKFETGDASKGGYGVLPWYDGIGSSFDIDYSSGTTRERDVKAYLKGNGYDTFTVGFDQQLLEAQLYYITIEQTNDNGAREYCKSSQDVEECIREWLRGYEGNYASKVFGTGEKTIFNERYEIAKELLEKYKYYTFPISKTFANVLLDIKITKEDGKYTFSGKMDRKAIAGTFYISENGNVTGIGYYGFGAQPDGGGEGTFVGVEDFETEKGKKIISSVTEWTDPFSQGYDYLCEGWVARVYRDAGYGYPVSCCAASSRDKNSMKTGKIPAGAAIYSGTNYTSSVLCDCGRDAGHVAIYIGDNMVAGSQRKFKMTLDEWIAVFGYGGWYF